MATHEQIVESIHRFLREELFDEALTLEADEPLIASGLVDSTRAVRLAAHLERAYGIAIGPVDFTLENFRSPRTLAALVRAKVAS